MTHPKKCIAAGVIAATAAASFALILGADVDLILLAGSGIAGAGVVAGLLLTSWAAKFAETSR